jgi:hypothetical protein
LVVDPFFGTGSAAIAARAMGCSFWGLDSDDEALRRANKMLECVSLSETYQLGSALEEPGAEPNADQEDEETVEFDVSPGKKVALVLLGIVLQHCFLCSPGCTSDASATRIGQEAVTTGQHRVT